MYFFYLSNCLLSLHLTSCSPACGLNAGVYGDVQRVKILYNKKDSALIQMSDANQAQLGKQASCPTEFNHLGLNCILIAVERIISPQVLLVGWKFHFFIQYIVRIQTVSS